MATYFAKPPVPVVQPEHPLSRGLCGFWSPRAGAVVHDATGQGNLGLLSAGASIGGGPFGPALSLSGGTSSMAVESVPKSDAGFSVGMWVKLSTNSGFPMPATFDTSAFMIWAFNQTPTLLVNNAVVVTGPTLALDTWYRILGTVDAASGIGSLYLNGVAVGSKRISGLVRIPDRLLWGARSDGYGMQGQLDGMAAWTRALSAQEAMLDARDAFAAVRPRNRRVDLESAAIPTPVARSMPRGVGDDGPSFGFLES